MLLAKGEGAFGEVKALGSAFLGAVGAVLFAEVHFDGGHFLAEGEADFVGVHFFGEFGGGLGALVFALSAFFAGLFDPGFLSAEFSAGGKIGEALEAEELGGCVLGGTGAIVGVGHDGVVDFFRRGLVAGFDGLDVGEGECVAGIEAAVDVVQGGLLFVEAFERAAGDVESVAAFGARFADAVEDDSVGLAFDPANELVEFGFGEGSEGGLDALFFHKCRI